MTASQDMKQWFAVRVKSRAEKKVSGLLQEKRIECYLPLQKKLSQWSDRKKLVDMPVVHGYVFVNILPETRLAVLQTRHVVSFVQFERKDAVIPPAQMGAMKCMLGQSEYPVDIRFGELHPGAMVTVRSGIMRGLVAELISIHGVNRITLRIPELNFNLLVDLPAEYL
jgi:transcription antitermination factor NusG